MQQTEEEEEVEEVEEEERRSRVWSRVYKMCQCSDLCGFLNHIQLLNFMINFFTNEHFF